MKKLLAIIFIIALAGGVYAAPPSAPTPAKQSKTDVTNFGTNLSSADDTVQKALDTLDEVTGVGDSTETNQDDAWATVGASGTETGIDVTYQDATNDVDFVVDVTPSAGSATLEIAEDAVQVKYDSTDFQESTNGLYLGTDPTISGSLIVDNITINGNDISSTAGTDLTITPLAGQQIVLDGTIVIDAGEVTGITSLGLTGTRVTDSFFTDMTVTNTITGSVSGTAATVTGEAQAAITSLGTLTTLTVDDITINANTISSAGASTLAITPTAGQAITFDGAVTVDAGVVAGITTMTLTGANASPTANGMLVYDNVTAGVDDGQFAYYGGSDTVYYFPSYVTLPTDSEDDYHLAYDMDTDRLYWREDADTGGTPIVITVADSADTTSSVAFFESATGDLGPKTDSQLTYNATSGVLTATAFAGDITGALTGNADTVTIADAANDTTTSVLLGTSATGSLAPATDASLTYNATTGELTATGFTGALTGNADTVTVADAANDTTTSVLLSVDATGSESPRTDSSLTYNANTGILTATGFAGNITGALTGNADTVTVADAANDTTTSVLLGTSATGSLAPATDASLTYNANTGALTATSIIGTTDIETALGAAYDTSGELDSLFAAKASLTSPVFLVSMEIPNGTSGTTDLTGEIYLDTNGDGAEFDGPVIQVSTNDATVGYIFTTAAFPGTAEDNYIMKYDAITDLVSWEADDTGSALGGNLSSTNNDITTDNTIIQLEDSSTSENLTITFSANAVAITSDSLVGSVDFGTIDLATDALDLSAGTITNTAQIDAGAGAALAIGDGVNDVVSIDSVAWDISGPGAASFVDLTIVKAEPIIVLDGTDNWEIRSDDTGNSIEISSAIGGGVGDNVELEIDTSGNVTATGTFFATVGFDVVGAADIDYGSANVTDHTFTTDGTGTAEIVLPAGSIDGTEILDDTIDSADYAADSIDNEHIQWSDIDNLDDEGLPIDFALTADATVADVVAIIFGTSSDWNIEYDETTDDRLEFTNIVGTSGDSNVYWDLNDTADSTFTITNSDGTGEANLVVEGDATVGTLTQAAKDDPKWYFDPATASESEWWVGINHDGVGDDNDNFEIRQSTTPGNSVEFYIQPDGDTFVTGDLTITGDDLFMGTNTTGMLLIADGTNFNPTAMQGDGAIIADGTLSVSDLTIASEARGDLITFNPGGVGGWERLATGTSGKYLTTDGTDLSWADVTATASDCTPDGGIQYEIGGAFACEAAFYYTQGSNILTVDAIGVSTEEVVIFADVASAVNEITISNAATGAFPIIQATGEADTGIDFENSEAEEGLTIDFIATATNNLQIANAANGSSPSITAVGSSDANVGILIDAKVAGEIIIGSADAKFSLVSDALNISNAGAISNATTIGASGDITTTEDLVIGDTKYIGSASDPDAAQIAANGEITLTQELQAGLGIDATGQTIIGDLTGNASTAATVTGATQASITTAANLVTVGALASGSLAAGFTDVPVAQGGTGASTLADGGLVIGNAAGAVEVVAAGATTEILVGGGASTAPVWTTAQGSGAPVRAGSPTLTTPNIGAATGTSLNLSGNLQGLIPITVTTAATLVMTTANTKGDLHQNGDADAIDYTLPAAAAGLSACFMAGEFTGVITIDPVDGTDTIYLNGASVGAGDSIDSPGTVGDFICLVAVDATKWYTLGQINTWVDGGP